MTQFYVCEFQTITQIFSHCIHRGPVKMNLHLEMELSS